MGRILAALLFAAALVAQNTPPSGGGGGSGTVGSGTAGQFAAYSSTGTAVGGNANLTDVAGSLTYSGAAGVQVTNASGDAGLIGVACNTTLPSIPSGYIGWIGCNSASATSYFYQPAVTAPSATGPMLVSAVSSNVVGVTYGTVSGTGTVFPTTASPTFTGTVTEAVVNASGAVTASAAGAASTPGLSVTGAPYTGGNGTSNFPQLYINDGAGPTTFSTAGTIFGVNAPSGFTGNLLDLHVNGGTAVFGVNSLGAMTSGSLITAGTAFQNAVAGSFRWGAAGSGHDIITSGADQTLAITGTAGSNIGFASSTAAQAGSVCVSSAGVITYDGTNTCLVSSRYFKHAITPMGRASSLVTSLKPVSFVYNGQEQRRYGLIAEQVEKVAPQLVEEGPDGAPLAVKYLELIPLLIQTAKEQQAEIAKLKAEIRVLERH